MTRRDILRLLKGAPALFLLRNYGRPDGEALEPVTSVSRFDPRLVTLEWTKFAFRSLRGHGPPRVTGVATFHFHPKVWDMSA